MYIINGYLKINYAYYKIATIEVQYSLYKAKKQEKNIQNKNRQTLIELCLFFVIFVSI